MTLFALDLPTLDLNFTYSRLLPIPPLTPPLYVYLQGTIGVQADFDFGFDTSGFRQFARTGNVGDIFNGFFLDDHISGSKDAPEIVFYGGIAVVAELDAFIPLPPPIPPIAHINLTVGAGGGLFMSLGFNLHDTVYGGTENDLIFALDGNDQVFAGAGRDTVYGVDGTDLIYGEDDGDVIQAGTENDTVYAEAGDDQVSGNAGDDFIVGGTGHDNLSGNAGRDIIWGGTESFGPGDFNRDDLAHRELPREFPNTVDLAEAELAHPSGYNIQSIARLVPVRLAGQSVEGQFGDGRDVIRGGGDTDWLFGGGDADDLDGNDGDDSVDGGSGHDLVHGGDGQDIVRGGSNNDIVHGDTGIDQLYGDLGNDHLFGGPGLTVSTGDPRFNSACPDLPATAGTKVHVQCGQRLWGGEGIGYLWGYAPEITLVDDPSTPNLNEIQRTYRGDEMHGGPGGDWLYGNIRREIQIGDEGNDTIYGDWLIGPDYATNTRADLDGANDMQFGGSGEDKLYGGGGNDELWGGADSD